MRHSITDLAQYKELYYVIKLMTGELLLVTMVDMCQRDITFEHPIVSKFVTTVNSTGITHHLSNVPYCPFASTRSFTVPRRAIQHINSMDKDMVTSYLHMVFGDKSGGNKDGMDDSMPPGVILH